MATPEELIAAQQKEIEDLKSKAGRFDALEAENRKLAEGQAKIEADNAKRELDLAKREALIEFPAAKEFEGMVSGANAAEIKANAKALHEKIVARDTEFKKKHGVKDNGLEDWKGVPGSVPPELLLASDRAQQYQKVRESNMPKRNKVALMMGMKIEDLYKKHVLDARQKLGIR